MGYYFCENCSGYFTTPYRVMYDETCPYCKDKHHIRSIQKAMYFEWLQVKTDSQNWCKYYEEKHHKMYTDAMLFYDEIEEKNGLTRRMDGCDKNS